ncbi:MAG: 23S rRNA (adenine(2503)-C(2))-methyltransferase RlmN [Lachnospiraceae bacterium]|nr:23S rRNA (adenine(2503)-C(2))-methyltransferase RlmN [Lachnospiraceae bacterium]
MEEKIDLKSMNKEELTAYMLSIGEQKFRASQLYEWIHVRQARSFAEMTNLSKALREKLSAQAYLTCVEMADVQISAIDGTRKYLFALEDGNMVESVLMKYKFGNSVCISSQVGCRMGCKFCASTLDGLERNLTPAEMLDQIYAITLETGERVSHVVIMGSGEPMDNYDNVVKFLGLLTDENGLHISQRDVTVSTCGIVPKIKELAKLRLQINLAISLHAPTDEKRKALMPIANSYTIKELLDAVKEYFAITGRRITFEYSLVRGKNDSAEEAKELIALLKGFPCHVNLIPVNPVEECGMRETSRDGVVSFMQTLEKSGIHATIRREMGRDIDGACGQLRRRHMKADS